ncbi:hypothetical protein ABEB36_004959 [Hypothenemus hampei]|uniref:Uncharacterized protein n=1 Tax=Hypothenemus hampei TaxID=57062 RepID=A0ABD1EWF4_HYPHA
MKTLKKKENNRKNLELALLISGVLLIVFGLVIVTFLTPIYEFILRKALEFRPDSESFKAWRSNNPPLDLDLYLFNWTNPYDIRSASVKPIFKEVGPYRVKEVKEKFNLIWNPNGTISYNVRKWFYFIANAKMNKKLREDLVTTINAVPLTAAYQAKSFNYFSKKLISFSISSLSSMHVTKTAKEILFDGYSDGILTALTNFPLLNVKDKFGIFYGVNGTTVEGVYNMHTITDEHFGRQLSWKHKNSTDFYTGHCSEIRGSATEFYPLNIRKTKLIFFSSELCKYAEMDFDSEVILKGVKGYKFIGDNIFDNGTLNPENRCFCVNECLPPGILDVSKCRDNSPSFLSFPHFYAADPYYRNLIEGMQPNRSRHQFYIIVEPKSGIIMDIGAHMQLNMLLQPITGFSLYENVQKIFIPMFYFTQHMELKDELAAKLRQIQNLPDYFNYSVFTFIASGLILILWSACSVFSVFYKRNELENNVYAEAIPFTEKTPQSL